VEKFKRFDTTYAEEKKKKFPHLVKGLPGPNDPGKGSVIWIGLNPDPCAAKWKAKMGITSTSSMPNLPIFDEERPASTSSSAKLRSPSATGGQLAATAQSAFGLTSASMKRRRDLARMSSIAHFLDQSKGLVDNAWNSGPRPQPGPRGREDPQELLYAGVTQDGEGRYGYLKTRKALFPQEKTEMPETCFQEVGWKLYLGKGSFHANLPRPYPPKPSTIIIS
jgi:hypothetical protein